MSDIAMYPPRTPAAAGAVVVSEAHATCAVSWSAVLAGAIAAASLSLILLALGAGLGLSSVSPWGYAGASAKVLGIGAIAWLLFMSAAASSLGGYLTGRLRAGWRGVSEDESYFRDTANGLLAWGIATIVSAAVLASAATSMVGGAVTAGAAAAPAVVAESNGSGYFVDMLMRGSKADPASTDDRGFRAETGRILGRSIAEGEMTAGDRTYLASRVQERTGLAPEAAAQRVDEITRAATSAADAARKIAAGTALWVFVSLLLGAFCAAFAATRGGRTRL